MSNYKINKKYLNIYNVQLISLQMAESSEKSPYTLTMLYISIVKLTDLFINLWCHRHTEVTSMQMND